VTVGDWVSLLGLVAGTTAFGAGLLQYMKAQAWKRAEFVANAIKEFESKRATREVMLMLDWYSREIELFPEDHDPKSRKAFVTDSMVAEALVPHTERPKGYSDVEAAIRDAFDEFLDGLERFQHFVESGLVLAADFRPYLWYWIEIMGNPANEMHPAFFRSRLWTYIAFYGYRGVQNLFGQYGFDIRTPPAI
jgi:hypothetical protein